MTRSLLRPTLVSLALLGAVALATRAQDDTAGPAAEAKESPKGGAEDGAKGDPVDKGDADKGIDKEAGAKEAAAAPRDFSGKYLADGQSNGGRAYRAMVEVTREGDVYQVVWVMGPNEGYMGVGMTEGNALCVGWSIGEVPGVVVYKADPKPDSKKLVGRWTAPGSRGQTYTETLTPLP